MCDPATVTLALGVTSIMASVGGSAASYYGQKQAAADQAAYQNQMAAEQGRYRYETSVAANKAYLDKASQEGFRQQQEDIATAQQTQQNQIDAMKARSREKTASAEAGVSGLSIDALIGDYYRMQGQQADILQQQREFSRTQSAADIRGYEAEAKNRVSSIRPYIPAPVQQPSLLATLADVTGAVAGGTYNLRMQNGIGSTKSTPRYTARNK